MAGVNSHFTVPISAYRYSDFAFQFHDLQFWFNSNCRTFNPNLEHQEYQLFEDLPVLKFKTAQLRWCMECWWIFFFKISTNVGRMFCIIHVTISCAWAEIFIRIKKKNELRNVKMVKVIKTLRPRQNGCRFVNIFNCFTFNQTSLRIFPNGSINNKSALIEILGCHWTHVTGDMPFIWTNGGLAYYQISLGLGEF